MAKVPETRWVFVDLDLKLEQADPIVISLLTVQVFALPPSTRKAHSPGSMRMFFDVRRTIQRDPAPGQRTFATSVAALIAALRVGIMKFRRIWCSIRCVPTERKKWD